MALTAEALRELDIEATPQQVEGLLLEALRRMATTWREADARHELTPGEAEALASSGLELERTPRGAEDPLLRTAIEYAALLASGRSVAETAGLLGVDPSRIRQRLAARTLYGIKQRAGWRLPAFQFTEGGPLPGLEVALPRLRPELHPVAVHRWFTTPNVDLVYGDEEVPLSPRDWLRLGLDPAEVAALAAEL